MWKILVGFIIFAAVSLFVIFKAGDKVSMQGEAGGHATAEVASVPEASASSAALSPTSASPAATLPAEPASDTAASK